MTIEDIEERIYRLRLLIKAYNYHYYVKSESLVSDTEYDWLYRELKRLEEEFPEYYDENSPTQKLTGQIE